MGEYIWLDTPLHKNKINFDTSDLKEDYKMSFDGSIVAFNSSLLEDKEEMLNEVRMYRMGYGEYELPKSIDSVEDLLKVLLYFSED